jgi:di- and tripeptidase
MYSAIVENHLRNDPSLDPDALRERLMSKWRFPSHTIHRINVSGPANATVIPRSATASISIRIVPDQDLQTIKETLTSYLHSEFGTFCSNNTLTITIDHEAEPWLGDPQNEAFKTLEQAIEDVWGNGVKPLYIREGGSIPSARFLEREFGAPAAHLPCGQASDHAHLDNERLRLTNLYKSKAILKRFFRELPKK